jgi:hypothetical protein
MSTEDNVIRPPFPASEQVTPEEHSRRVLVEVQRLCGLAPDEWRIWYKRSAVEQLKIEPDDLKLMIEAELKTRVLATWRTQMLFDEPTLQDSCCAFNARGDLLRRGIGLWDACDPVAHTLLDVIETQNDLAKLFDLCASHPVENEDALFKDAIERRHAAGKKLMQALEDRNQWPNPNLGAICTSRSTSR